MKRDPRTPSCSVDGCPHASRRLGLCRGHAANVPPELSIELSVACMSAQRALRREYHARARAIATAAAAL